MCPEQNFSKYHESETISKSVTQEYRPWLCCELVCLSFQLHHVIVRPYILIHSFVIEESWHISELRHLTRTKRHSTRAMLDLLASKKHTIVVQAACSSLLPQKSVVIWKIICASTHFNSFCVKKKRSVGFSASKFSTSHELLCFSA